MSVQILHGPALLPEKRNGRNRKNPTTWSYGARLNPEMATKVDNLARSMKVSVADVLRTAIMHFLALPENDPLLINSIVECSSAPAIAQPRVTARYTGSGGSDRNALAGVRQRQTDRLRKHEAGERLVDKTPTR
jgi:hypothetical protein